MSESVLATLGVMSGVVNTIAMLPYLRDVIQHKTKPERATWWIWFVLALFAFYAQVNAGAKWSLITIAAGAVALGVVAVLSVKFGYGTLHRRDILCLGVAAVGVVISRLIDSPLTALLIVIAIEILGYSLTLIKTWAAPHSETLGAWVLLAIAAALGVLAVGSFNFTQLIFPIYLFLANASLAGVIFIRRHQVKQDAPEQ